MKLKKYVFSCVICVIFSLFIFSCKFDEDSSSYSYLITGEYYGTEDFYVTPHSGNYKYGVLQILNSKGELKKSIDLPSHAYSWKKIEYPDGQIRYAYQQVLGCTKYTTGYYEDSYLVILDENFNKVRDNIRMLKSPMIPQDNWPLENHDYEILGDDHYILTAVVPVTVTNIPGYSGEGYNLFNSVIQEQKDGKVVWEFQSIDYPELYQYCHDYCNTPWNWNDLKFQVKQGENTNYNDYIHFNALSYDSQSDAFLISFRGLGIIKIDRKTKEIIWIISSMQKDDITSEHAVDVSVFADKDVFGYFQHDINFLSDGSFTVFDNHIIGGFFDKSLNGNSRILKYKIDDASKKLTEFKEYKCAVQYSQFMGSAKLLDEENETFLINYGGNISDPAFEIYSFKENKQLMKMKYNKGYDLYNIGYGTYKAIEFKY